MKLFIKKVKIIDPQSDYNNQIINILIEDGIIKDLGTKISAPENVKIIEIENLHASPGFFDLKSNFRDPGYEIKEDIHSGSLAAQNGGFTGVLLMPTTNPSIDSKTQVSYIKNQSQNNLVDIHPAGSITKNNLGKELTEMYDMYCCGAKAFTDDTNSIQKSGILKLALEYNKQFDGLVINQPNEKSLNNGGSINEGITSTSLGLKGIPSISEELMIQRDLELAEYTDSKIHITCISTKNSVDIIRKAKAKGVKVTCDVSINNLIFDDNYCLEFDTNYKVFPPLRTNSDILALINGLNDGTIDAICSDHRPEDIEHKQSEFENSEFGILGLQTLFPAACSIKNLDLEKIIEKISIKPREILQLEKIHITKNHAANICFYNPNEEWLFKENDVVSKSKNSPFINKKLSTKVIGVINGLKTNL